ncbi:hypothetical protein [Streptomyces hawaiiensis]|uniref:hypothetical protein n=1 Tax=Streptomyces hawaiiensis TaxID=67305 RepID=UPI0036621C2E
MTEPKPTNRGTSALLATVGLVLIAAALSGFFLDLNSLVINALLTLGVILLVISVLAPRMEGKQVLRLIGEINLAKAAEQAEVEIASGDIVPLDEVVEYATNPQHTRGNQ